MANSKRSKWLRILLWTLAVLILLPTLLYVVLLLCNLRDDPLSPEVEKLLAAQPAAIAPEKNGYFAWIGIRGPEDQDPHAWGLRWFEQALIDDKAIRSGAMSGNLAKDSRKEPALSEFSCVPAHDCLEKVAAKPAAARAALSQGRITLARGDTVLAYPAYQEAWRPDYAIASQLPFYGNNWNTLSAIRFSLGAAEGKHAAALAQLEREIAFCTRQLEGSATLIHKIVGLTNLRSRYNLLSEYIRRFPSETRQHKIVISRMLSELSPAASSMRSVLQFEQRLMVTMISDLPKEVHRAWLTTEGENPKARPIFASVQEKLATPLYLPNATINESVEQFDVWLHAEAQEGIAYRRALADARKAYAGGSMYSLRNPIGHILATISGPQWGEYLARRDDLLALRALVFFQFNLVLQDIHAQERLAQAVEENEATLTHRYTGKLPSWDAEYKQLSYTPSHPQNKKHIVSIRRQ